jgi:dihydrofolate reductase
MKVVANMSVSLDGFVAEPTDGIGELFDWYNTGPVDVTMPGEHQARFASMSQASAEYLQRMLAGLGAIVAGRRLYDVANGWGGQHPSGQPVVVVTHHVPAEPPYPEPGITFAGDVQQGIERAVVLAKGRNVALASPTIVQQALALGLLDQIAVELVPVLFGAGVRLFGELIDGHVLLDDPEVVQGTRVTHLTYTVRR